MTGEVTRVDKPWGYELHWAKTDRYVGKLIHVNAGHALSLQYHNQKDETIFLWSGRLLFEIKQGEDLVKRELKVGEAVHITPLTVHRIEGLGLRAAQSHEPGGADRESLLLEVREDLPRMPRGHGVGLDDRESEHR